MRIACAIAAVAAVAAAGRAADPKPVVVQFGRRSAEAPAGWQAEKPANRLRAHQFRLPAGRPGLADAEVVVTPDSPPDPAKSFPRWRATVTAADGAAAAVTESKFEAGGATVHLLDAAGTWRYKEFPQSKKKEEDRPGYRVVWAVVADPDGGTHVRLSGPAEVVGNHYPAFEKWLRTIR